MNTPLTSLGWVVFLALSVVIVMLLTFGLIYLVELVDSLGSCLGGR